MPFPRFAASAVRAGLELAWARLFLHSTRPAEVFRRNAQSARAGAAAARGSAPEVADSHYRDVAAFISAMAIRVPWRADCLVQAMAAQRWLMRKGLPSEIVVGAAKHPDGRFEAHAWLLRGEAVLLGGDIERFEPLLDSAQAALRQP